METFFSKKKKYIAPDYSSHLTKKKNKSRTNIFGKFRRIQVYMFHLENDLHMLIKMDQIN